MAGKTQAGGKLGAWSAAAAGGLAGVFLGLSWLAELPPVQVHWGSAALWLLAAGVGCAAAALVTRRALLRWSLSWLPEEARDRVSTRQGATYLVFLLYAVEAGGTRLSTGVLTATLLFGFALLNLLVVLSAGARTRTSVLGSVHWLAFLFFLSGLAALIYQTVWQRVLFATIGVNIESVTVVVTVFMSGLGLGALLGGALSKRYPEQLPILFLASEAGVGLFGVFSIPLIHGVGALTVQGSLGVTIVSVFALLAVPTMLMGATLPVLVAHLHRYLKHVGRSVGLLYLVNTLGSAFACWLVADVLFVYGGQQLSVLFAALCNVVVGALVWLYMKRSVSAEPAPSTEAA